MEEVGSKLKIRYRIVSMMHLYLFELKAVMSENPSGENMKY